MISGILASTVLFLAAAGTEPATVSTSAASPKAEPADKTTASVRGKAKDDPGELVCHAEIAIGSRLPVKTCMTRGEAAMRKFEDRQNLEKSQGDTYRSTH